MATAEEEGLADFKVYFIREGNGIGYCLVIFTGLILNFAYIRIWLITGFIWESNRNG